MFMAEELVQEAGIQIFGSLGSLLGQRRAVQEGHQNWRGRFATVTQDCRRCKTDSVVIVGNLNFPNIN